MPKKVSIIGAGLAGLSTGIYLREAGVDTEIFELAPWAGGMCAAWHRKGYRFDGGVQWIAGTGKSDPVYKLYKEVGALADDTVIYNAGFIHLEINGVLYSLPLEISGFRAYLLTQSEEDASRINALCKDIDTVRQAKLLADAPSRMYRTFQMLGCGPGFLNMVRKYKGITVGEFSNLFRSDIMRKIFVSLMPQHFSAVALIVMLGTRMGISAGYPIGGASGIIRRMTEKYRLLGGQIHFNARVDEILAADGKVKGIRSKDTIFKSDGVVAACDAYMTLRHLLRGQFKHPQLEDMLSSIPLCEPLAVVSFGLDRKFDIPFSAAFECPEGFETAPGALQYGYHVRAFDFDDTAAPYGGSSVMAMFNAPLDYWMNLRHDHSDAYRLRKEQLAEAVAAKLDMRYPGFKDAIAVVDIATPATYIRLTHVYKASCEGFAPTPQALKTKIKKTLPGLKGIYICGQWTMPGGGVYAAIADGKAAARFIKREIN